MEHMRAIERGRIRRGSVVVGAVVALTVGVVVPASAVDTATGLKNLAPAKSGQGVPDGSDTFEAMKAAIGLEGMKNQEDLNAFKTWLVSLPGVFDQGFYESEVNIADRAMTLQWH